MSSVGLGVRRTALHEAHHVGVDLPQTLKRFVGSRYERPVSFPLRLFVHVVEPLQIPEHRRLRWHRPTTLDSPSPLQRPALSATHTTGLELSQHLEQPFVLLKEIKVGHRLAACQVQQHQRDDHLAVRPTLTSLPQSHVAFYR